MKLAIFHKITSACNSITFEAFSLIREKVMAITNELLYIFYRLQYHWLIQQFNLTNQEIIAKKLKYREYQYITSFDYVHSSVTDERWYICYVLELESIS